MISVNNIVLWDHNSSWSPTDLPKWPALWRRVKSNIDSVSVLDCWNLGTYNRKPLIPSQLLQIKNNLTTSCPHICNVVCKRRHRHNREIAKVLLSQWILNNNDKKCAKCKKIPQYCINNGKVICCIQCINIPLPTMINNVRVYDCGDGLIIMKSFLNTIIKHTTVINTKKFIKLQSSGVAISARGKMLPLIMGKLSLILRIFVDNDIVVTIIRLIILINYR